MAPAIFWLVIVDRVENLAEEHSDKVDTMRLDQNIGNLTKLAFIFLDGIGDRHVSVDYG